MLPPDDSRNTLPDAESAPLTVNALVSASRKLPLLTAKLPTFDTVLTPSRLTSPNTPAVLCNVVAMIVAVLA
jgi:hypothetical protein